MTVIDLRDATMRARAEAASSFADADPRAGDRRETQLPPSADLVVVGAGLMGSAAAWAASRRGLSVVLLEQFDVGHARGSSHGSARIVRRAYADPLYTRLTGEAFELWRQLESDAGASLLRMTGGLDHGAAHDVPRIAQVLTDANVPHELLDAGEAMRRWPGMVFDGPVLHHPQAGTVDADAAVRAAVDAAAGGGAVVAERTRVTGIQTAGLGGQGGLDAAQRVVVTTTRGEVSASRVVVAAGAWIAELLAGSPGTADVPMPPLEVTQQQVFHFARRDGVPEWPIVVARGELSTYSLPGGRDGLHPDGREGARKIAEHLAGPRADTGPVTTTATTRSGVVDDAARNRIVDHVERWYPGLEPVPFAEATCLYTTTPTEDFVLDRVGPVVVASPCSGHGAKFAPLIGELVVDLATGVAEASSRRTADLARFRLAAHAALASRPVG